MMEWERIQTPLKLGDKTIRGIALVECGHCQQQFLVTSENGVEGIMPRHCCFCGTRFRFGFAPSGAREDFGGLDDE